VTQAVKAWRFPRDHKWLAGEPCLSSSSSLGDREKRDYRYIFLTRVSTDRALRFLLQFLALTMNTQPFKPINKSSFPDRINGYQSFFRLPLR